MIGETSAREGALLIKRFARDAFRVVLFFAGVCFFWDYCSLKLRTAFADDQMEIFDEMRTRALQSNSPSDITGALGYACHYYPSGSKQKTGSRLDTIVERHRASVVRDIIAHLRKTTGHDLGDNPEPWVEKHSHR